MESDEARKLALFRYGIVAPLIGGFLKECSKEAFYRIAAEREYTLPDGKTARFKPATIKKWFLSYRKNGLDALVPKSRSDAGQTRTLNERACGQILKYKEQFPKITGQKRISMFYIISGNTELYAHLHEIYNCRTHRLKQNPLHKLEYMCSSSQKLLMLALHLYNNRNCKNITPFEILNNLDRYNLDLALNALHLRFS